MDQINHTRIITDCGKEFELHTLEPLSKGSLNANQNYTFTIYRTPTQEYIQKKSFFNPAMNHTSINYEVISESAYRHLTTTLANH